MNEFYTRQLKVRRLTGRGPYGDQHAPEVTVMCRLKYETKLVRNAAGEEVVAKGTASMDVGTASIPEASLVQAPGETVWRKVVAESRHVGGFDMSPDYYSIEIA